MELPLIYHTTSTGQYSGCSAGTFFPRVLESDPLIPKVPAMATLKEPPECVPEEMAVLDFEKDEWTKVKKPPVSSWALSTDVEIHEKALLVEIAEVFPQCSVMIVRGEPSTIVSIDSLLATSEHIVTMTNIIESHDSKKALMDDVRRERTHRIESTEWIRTRHSDELQMIEAGLLDKTTLTNYNMAAWYSYWKELRDIPDGCDIKAPRWPVQPSATKLETN